MEVKADRRERHRTSISQALSRRKRVAAIACICVALAACGNAESPEARVRRSIEAIEQAAEERDVSGVTEHASEQFRDDHGRDQEELSRYLRGYFIANQSIHLLTRISSIEFPAPDEARVQLTVAMVGREMDEADAWNLAGEIHDFDVTFRREDDEWKVIYLEVLR